MHWFVVIVYQPFLNLLVAIYWVLQQLPNLPHRDMGVAVVIFTIAFRIILLPISLASKRSDKDRRALKAKYDELTKTLSHDPVKLRHETKQLFRSNPLMLAAATFDLVLQACIAFMLWRIFAYGLEGADLHYLYSFTPHPPTPYDLTFWGLYDLSRTNVTLNIAQSLVILIVEAFGLWTSPYPIKRQDMVELLILLPGVSFLIFMFLPAGKKLFIITTLLFGLVVNSIRLVRDTLSKWSNPPEVVKVEATNVTEKTVQNTNTQSSE